MNERHRLPDRRAKLTMSLRTEHGPITVTTGEYPDGRVGEIFLDGPKEGAFSRDAMTAFAMAVSIGLQHGVPLESFLHTFRHSPFAGPIFEAITEAYFRGKEGKAA